ncbi:MAG: lipoprotein [Gammaproteobacteria bacterium]|nr:lipoprotein [Gammaproteobacteria bacterium]MBU1441064.1 lipoprotein [Gammaproteobacteria bacterium]MBU2284962.1 lipoprotein [Gammaproteobacteria bacterium]MBU2409474.1 lipoprotein [Gammaproteobacteria bacterium]
MLNVCRILVSALSLALLAGALSACGQRGPLYLPTDPAAKGRATLPQLLIPNSRDDESTQTPPRDPAPPAGSDQK